MPTFPGQQFYLPHQGPPYTDNDHFENYRSVLQWNNQIPVTKLAQLRLAGVQATITINIPVVAGVRFSHLKFYIEAVGTDAANQPLFLRFNGDAGANYDYQSMVSNGAVTTSASSLAQTGGRCGQVAATATTTGGISEITLMNYQRSVLQKTYIWQGGVINGPSQQHETGVGRYSNTVNPITSVLFFPSAGSFDAETSVIFTGIF